MQATITGIVYNDLNHNGKFDTGEPGIPGVCVIVYARNFGCTTVMTDESGRYTFTTQSAADYTILETVAGPVTCLPKRYTQPPGFTMSNGPRKLYVTVTDEQVNKNEAIDNIDFSHDTVNKPVSCQNRMIHFKGTPSNWYDVNLVTGESTRLFALTPPDNVSAIGYNILDHYIYGYNQTTNGLVRVDESGQMIELPLPTGLPPALYTAGAIDKNGFYYLYLNNETRFYTVDLRPNSPTYLKLVFPYGDYTEQTSNYGRNLLMTVGISAWAWNPFDYYLYGIEQNGTLVQVVPTSGKVLRFNTSPAVKDAVYGSVAIDSTGGIYGVSSVDGIVYKYTINVYAAKSEVFSKINAQDFQNGVLCPTAALQMDYGDAPDAGKGSGPGSYSTLLSSNGPRHQLGKPLTLGRQITADTDARQNPAAIGDDIAGGVPDDALSVPLLPLSLHASGYTLPVTVTNETGVPANLYGWIDFNQNGLFEVGEDAPVVSVPSATGLQTVSLVFTVPTGVTLNEGETFVRLRLTTDELTSTPGGSEDSRSVGAASDGEVEDYGIRIGDVADLEVKKTANRTVLDLGDAITYTITVINNGPDSAAGCVLTDTVSPGLYQPKYSLDGGTSWQPWLGSLSLGTLDSGKTVTITLQGICTEKQEGGVVNQAVISSAAIDPKPANNIAAVTLPLITSADLAVTNTAVPSPVKAGESIVYTIHMSNAGPGTAKSVLLSWLAPEVLAPQFSVDGGDTWEPFSSPYPMGNIPAGAHTEIQIKGTAASFATGIIVSRAALLSSTPDPDQESRAVSTGTPVNEQADLTAFMQSSPGKAPARGYLNYNIMVSNHGPSDAKAVVMTDDLPSQIIGGEYSPDFGVTWLPWPGQYSIGDMVAGSIQKFMLRGLVSPSATGKISNMVTVKSDTPDPNMVYNTAYDIADANPSADLTLAITDTPVPAEAGKELTYAITIINKGPSDAESVKLTDTLPAEFTAPEYSVDGGGTYKPWNGTADLGTVPGGVTLPVLLRGTVNSTATGVITHSPSLSSPTPDPYPVNNQTIAITPIGTSADLMVRAGVSPTPAIPGQKMVYTLDITNNGPDPAINTVLTIPGSAFFVAMEYSTDVGATWQSWTGSYALGNIARDAVLTVLVRGNILSSAFDFVNTEISVASDTPDPNPANNKVIPNVAVNESSDLSLTLTGTPSPVNAGEQMTYTITIKNHGPGTAKDAKLNDVTARFFINPEFAVEGSCDFAPWVSPYPIGDLKSGESLVITMRGTIEPGLLPGSFGHSAQIMCQTDPNNTNDSAEFEVIMNNTVNLAVSQTTKSSIAVPGQPFEYTVTVTNAGPSATQQAVIVDTLPPALLNPEFSRDGGATFLPWPGIPINTGVIQPQESKSMLIRGTVSPLATGKLINTAGVNNFSFAPNPSNSVCTEETPIAPSADLSTYKAGEPSPTLIGGRITYKLLVSNAGPSKAEQVMLEDDLPAGLSVPELSTDGGRTWSFFDGTYAIGQMEAGDTRTILLRASVTDAIRAGNIKNRAAVTSLTPDPNPANNLMYDETQAVPSADVSVVKTVAQNPVKPGNTLTYTITVANAGPADAQDVSLKDDVPAGLTNVQFSTDGGKTYSPWRSPHSLGNMTAKESRTILIEGTAGPGATGSMANTAAVTSTSPDPDLSNNTSSVTFIVGKEAELSVEKTVKSGSAIPGTKVVYSITVTNNGPDSGENVRLYDMLPAQLTGAEYSEDDGKSWKPWAEPHLLGTLTHKETINILLRGTVAPDASGCLLNTAVVSSDTPDSNPVNNTATASISVMKGADLSIFKEACCSCTTPCQYITYKITVLNKGPETAQNVIISDPMPDILERNIFSINDGRTWRSWKGKFTVGRLLPDKEVSILISGFVNPCAKFPICNKATVSSATFDPDLQNNTFTLTTPLHTSKPCDR